MTRLRRMNADQVESILRKYGFELISQKGSHRKWRDCLTLVWRRVEILL
jgi:predicted RNA binding protein YcfA (HicA-like mRNA interferase family)